MNETGKIGYNRPRPYRIRGHQEILFKGIR